MYIDENTGARVIDKEKCTGCGSCAKACPLNPEVNVINFKTVNGRRQAFKCDLCKDRAAGPVCVQTCPTSALVFIHSQEI
jgi:Fe-S-cluster-containing hydrogenase component 2